MTHLSVVQGDITTIDCQAIVNAANSSLLGGGGVDGAIHRAAGAGLLAECRAIVARQGGCAPGDAVITSGCDLDAEYVIHTVGPVWRAGQAEVLNPILASCYTKSLQLALDHDVRSIAFPNISTGVYGYPKDTAALVAISAVKNSLIELSADGTLERVVFVCFDPENTALYQTLL